MTEHILYSLFFSTGKSKDWLKCCARNKKNQFNNPNNSLKNELGVYSHVKFEIQCFIWQNTTHVELQFSNFFIPLLYTYVPIPLIAEKIFKNRSILPNS